MYTRRLTQGLTNANQMPRQNLGGSSRARKMIDKSLAPEQLKRNLQLALRNQMQSQTTRISHNFAPNVLLQQISSKTHPQGTRLTKETLNKHDELAGKSSLQKKRLEKLLPKNGSKKSAITMSNSTQQSSSNNKGAHSSKKQNKLHDMDSKSCKSFASQTTACTRVGNKRLCNQKIGDVEKSMRGSGKRQRHDGNVTPCHSILSFGEGIRSPDKSELINEQKRGDEQILLTKKNDPNYKKEFNLWYETNLQFLTSKKKMLAFDLSKLEIEYDYDTDEEQIYRAKKLLKNEFYLATDFYVKEDPLVLVGNLQLKNQTKQKKN